MADEKSYKQIRDEFYLKYQKELMPKLTEFENERKTTYKKTIRISVLIFIAGVILACLIFFWVDTGKVNDSDGLFQLDFFILALAFVYYGWQKKSFENKIKYKIMPDVGSCFGNLVWRPNKSHDVNLYIEANLIPKSLSGYFFDDCFSGKYNDVAIEIEECSFSVGSGKNRRTVFDGVIISLSMNKSFKGKTVIKPDSWFHFTPSKELKHTVLEDVEFEKKYDVFTDDEVEARYLITPSLMERLNNIKLSFKANKISASFYNDSFFIALHTNKDLFSIGSLTKPAYDPNQIFQMFEEMMSIYRLIDHFKLDQKIGL